MRREGDIQRDRERHGDRQRYRKIEKAREAERPADREASLGRPDVGSERGEQTPRREGGRERERRESEIKFQDECKGGRLARQRGPTSFARGAPKSPAKQPPPPPPADPTNSQKASQRADREPDREL